MGGYYINKVKTKQRAYETRQINMGPVTRNQRKKLDMRVTVADKLRFAEKTNSIILSMREVKNDLPRCIEILKELIAFISRKENKIVFESSFFMRFKYVLYGRCLEYSSFVSKEERKFLFTAFV